jgi:cytoskeletal protein CcmA (bactofilin family)
MKIADNTPGREAIVQGAPQEQVPAPSATVPYAPGQVWVEERTRVAVGRGASISGRLIFHEPVRIEGYFRGEVVATDLVVIAQEGSVQGRVRAPRMLVLGELRGDVTECERIVLGPRSRLYGRIETVSLTICEGAYLDGDIRMPKAALDRARQTETA